MSCGVEGGGELMDRRELMARRIGIGGRDGPIGGYSRSVSTYENTKEIVLYFPSELRYAVGGFGGSVCFDLSMMATLFICSVGISDYWISDFGDRGIVSGRGWDRGS